MSRRCSRLVDLMSSDPRLAGSYEKTRKYRKNAAVRLARWVSQRVARNNGRRSDAVRFAVEAFEESTCGYSLHFLRASSWARAVAVQRDFAGLADSWGRKRCGRSLVEAALGSRCYRRLPPPWCCSISQTVGVLRQQPACGGERYDSSRSTRSRYRREGWRLGRWYARS